MKAYYQRNPQFIVILLAGLAAHWTETEASLSKAHPELLAAFKQSPTMDVIVSFFGTNSLQVIEMVRKGGAEAYSLSRTKTIDFLVESLEEQCDKAYSSTYDWISKQIATGKDESMMICTKLWINCELSVKNCNLNTTKKLMTFPQVMYVREDEVFSNIVPQEGIITNYDAHILAAAPTTGVSQVEAPNVWNLYNNGSGSVVASIDTGIMWNHPDLVNNYRSNDGFSWYDPYYNTTVPNDSNGHGTHTMGTMVGRNGTGVAPGAKWISCKGCNGSTCQVSALLSCGQWCIKPGGDTTKAPHVICNSWAGGSGQSWYDATIAAWTAAGICNFFAAGNSGTPCNTTLSPGDRPGAYGVGAVDSSNKIAYFSSFGPAGGTLIKPNIVGPGLNVISCWNDGTYNTLSGTSMATPHMCGVYALCKAQNPSWTISTIINAMYNSCTLSTIANNSQVCGGTPYNASPNNMVGYGLPNAYTAIQQLMGSSS